MKRILSNAIVLFFAATPCWAWGDEGHMIVAAVAERLLEPGVRDQVTAMLDADDDTLTSGDFASRATCPLTLFLIGSGEW